MAQELVLLTGATGMVGFRVLVRVLAKRYHVRCAVRSQEGFDKIKSLPTVAPFSNQIECIIVPDITVSGAYDEAVKGVTYIIHVASPLGGKGFTDFENELIKPSVQGVLGMLDSANKEIGIKRMVVTGSIGSIVESKVIFAGPSDNGVTYNEKSRAPTPSGPYENEYEAYFASKVLSFQASQSFMEEKRPSFNLITIGPTYVFGRDDTVTDASNISKGTNGIVMGQLLGQAPPFPAAPSSVYLDDVARLHVDSLSSEIVGNQFFLAASDEPGSPTWADALEIVKKRYPKEVSNGTFKVNPGPASPLRFKFDTSYTEKTFGFKFRTIEEQVLSVAEHYLELIRRK